MRSTSLLIALFVCFSLGCETAATSGTPCTASSMCGSPLVCRLGRCRAECTENRDCPIATRCLLNEDGLGSCSLDVDDRCESGGHACPSGLICVDDDCANSCTDDTECPADGICRVAETTDVSFCFAPERGDSGLPRPDVGVVDGGVQTTDSGVCPPSVCGQALSMCAGVSYACAIRADHAVMCWGLNDQGQLGDGTGSAPATHHACTDGDCAWQAVHVREGGRPVYADGIACAERTVCAYEPSGYVQCWGSAADWQTGLDPVGGTVAAEARRLPDLVVSGAARQLIAGQQFFCATTAAGPSCWGNSYFGEIGARFAGPPEVVSGTGTLVAAGANTCFVDGANVSCRGIDTFGQLGPRGTGSGATFVALDPFAAPVVTLGGPVTSLCALAGTSVSCWGLADCGTAGTGSSSGYTRVAMLAVPGHAHEVLWTGGGSYRVCARTVAGEAECWGTLGPSCGGTTGIVDRVPELDGAVAVALGTENVCMIDGTGVVRCMGESHYGMLGRPASDEVVSTFEPICIADSCPP